MKFYYYKIINIENGSFYIGITTKYKERQKQHLRALRSGRHVNYKLQEDYDLYGEEKFIFQLMEELESDIEEAYAHERFLIDKHNATKYYNILLGGKLNPVYSPQVIEKLKATHQDKYQDILQYHFDGKSFKIVARHAGIREACRNTCSDFRAVQNAIKTTNAHRSFYWIKDGEQNVWLEKFLNRFNCCVAKIDEKTGQIEDTALTIREFAEKYKTTYQRIYASIVQNNRCERKYKFIRITAKEFADINNLSL